MNGIQQILAEDLFSLLSASDNNIDNNTNCCTLDNTTISMSFFEMYGGFVQDLLNERNRLKILEDGKGEIHINGLVEMDIYDPEQFLDIINIGNNARTTHVTEANDTSSRSHSICQIMLKDRYNSNKLVGKLSLVDLAGSERGTDTKSHNQQRRAESADINTSLLSLKECIRALDINKKQSSSTSASNCNKSHVPYRGSKLTLILKDCFTSDQAMTTMIATISPGASSSDHSINTLRYADRIKSHNTHTSSSSNNNNKGNILISNRRREQMKQHHEQESSPSLASIIDDEVPKSRSNTTTTSTTNNLKDNKNTHLFIENDVLSSNKIKTIPKQHHQNIVQKEKSYNNDLLLRQTIESIIEQEENILSIHMNNIQKNAELLTIEGDLLSAIEDTQFNDISINDINEYTIALEEILDQKEDMILNLQNHIKLLQQQSNQKI